MSKIKTIFVCLICLIFFFLPGCLDQFGGRYLNLELLSEDRFVSFNEDYINLTLKDLSLYPTLKESILEILDPTTNITEIFVKITKDEMDRIITEILSTPENDIYNFIAYDEYLFQIWFVMP